MNLQSTDNSMISTFYKNKKVLVTGHTGFKGGWLTAWLKMMGANVAGISLPVKQEVSHFKSAKIGEGIENIFLDIRDINLLSDAVKCVKPDFIFHLAAQALVPQSYSDPIATWETNLMGSLNLLEAARKLDNSCSVVMITSDKCYENNEWLWGYREIDRLGGIDPYSASKGACEIAIRSHVKSYFLDNNNIRVATARAGNVIGGGDWNYSRLVPDCVRSWENGEAAILRSPNSTRPWQHVLEPLSGYLLLGKFLCEDQNIHGESFNFGPRSSENYSVLSLVEEMGRHWDGITYSAQEVQKFHEAGLLKLNCEKAEKKLNWTPTLHFEEVVRLTSCWYRAHYQCPENIAQITQSQIEGYINSAQQGGQSWAQ